MTSISQNIADGVTHTLEIERVLASGETPYQRYRVLELKAFGKALELNGCIQSTELDESLYHECLIFPAFAYKPDIKNVLCFGGANGGVLNRLQLVESIENVVQVDLDPFMYKISKHYMSHLQHSESLGFNFRQIFEDRPAFWPKSAPSRYHGYFDLIIADLPDATEDSYVPDLFVESFYMDILKLLAPNGLFVTQAGQLNIVDMDFVSGVHSLLSRVFDRVALYSNFVPSYGTPWGFVLAGMGDDFTAVSEDELKKNLAVLDLSSLEFYDLDAHKKIFANTKKELEILDRYTLRKMTDVKLIVNIAGNIYNAK